MKNSQVDIKKTAKIGRKLVKLLTQFLEGFANTERM